MSFTTRCFIRKNSKELQEKLADIGYSICRCVNFTNAEWLSTLLINGTVHGKGYFYVEIGNADWTVEQELNRFVYENPSSIDCGKNEDLFLAIAALRDDSDIHQLFTDGENWVKSDIHNLIKFKEYFEGIGFDYHKTHKATVEELINHFK